MNNTSPQCMQERLLTSAERHATYEPPAIIFEVTLEVRAGTPLGLPDALDAWDGLGQPDLLVNDVAFEPERLHGCFTHVQRIASYMGWRRRWRDERVMGT